MKDGIPEALCSLKYSSVHNGAKLTLQLGKEVLRAKIDLQNVYRILPIHSDNRRLLGARWNGQIYAETALSFGLFSPQNLQCFCRLLGVGDATRRYPVIYVVNYNPLHR